MLNMVSIVIPFYNEEENLLILLDEICANLGDTDFELIFVDDGSIDNSKNKIENARSRIKDQKGKIVIISHGRRLGKGKALASGLRTSSGDVIIFMDADLQDDPADITKFLDKIDAGFDVVNGWRRDRRDAADKTLPSKIANTLLWRWFLNSELHDVNCGFKAFRRAVLEEIVLYGDNYRFIPLVAEKKGYRVGEVVVHHRLRKHGVSKYTFTRLFSGFIDTLTTYFIFRFSEKPLHFFGLIGGAFFGIGSVLSLYFIIQRLFFGELLYRRPAFLLSLVFVIVGLQIIMTGILAELVVYLDKKKNTILKN